MKNRIPVLCILVLLLSFPAPIFAQTIYQAVRPTIYSDYTTAKEANNHSKIIEYGNEIINYYQTQPDSPDKLAVVAPKYMDIARSYEAMGSYQNAIANFQLYIPLAEMLGWDDGVAAAKAKIQVLKSYEPQLFAKVDSVANYPYTGGKYEPKAGLYWGKIHSSFVPEKDMSAKIIYVEYGDTHFTLPEQGDFILQFAWNVTDGNLDLMRRAQNDAGYIQNVAESLAGYGGPVLLRYGAEMNNWSTNPDPQEYIQSYRVVTSIVRQYAPNVAFMWCPLDVTGIDIDTNAYYPGDDWVDWIGISSYTSKYFKERNDWGSMTDSYDTHFFTGRHANPLAKLAELVDTYGGKKPILISESGTASQTPNVSERHVDWATVRMEKMYAYVPMLYPEIKGIVYFDQLVASTGRHFALYTEPEMQKAYNNAVAPSIYLSGLSDTAPYMYQRCDNFTTTNKTLDLHVYAMSPYTDYPEVSYYLDGSLVRIPKDTTFSYQLDIGSLSKGGHTLEIRVKNGDIVSAAKTYSLQVADTQTVISVKNSTF